MNMDTVWITLEIMGKGMLGIFTAIFVIMCFVWIAGKLSKNKN